MGYVTHITRSAVAANNGDTLAVQLGLSGGDEYISVGAVVATPTSSGNVPDVQSATARIVWLGPSNVNSTGSTIAPSGSKAIAVDATAGEALWLTMTVLQ